jgi:5'-nucleotidase
MRILVTNDDGIHAPGLAALVGVAREFGEVKIAAPDRERSACGHALTMRDPLRVHSVRTLGVEAYEVNGLPVDCVNVGLTVAWPDGCDLILSGINNGPNLGFDITYSGTVAAAMEGTINGIRSIALSMALLEYGQPIDYAVGGEWLRIHWNLLTEVALPGDVFLNVNVPNLAYEEIQGFRVAPMGKRVYRDRVEMREDPWGRPYYWQGGAEMLDHPQPGTDVDAVRRDYVAVTPLSIDWTDEGSVAQLNEAWAGWVTPS